MIEDERLGTGILNSIVHKKECENLTTGVVNCPASFLVVRLMLWKGAAWGLVLIERGGARKWQVRDSYLQLDTSQIKNEILTTCLVNCTALYFGK